jgi:ABC-type multidrug transport system fused ATPase/permease subunit
LISGLKIIHAIKKGKLNKLIEEWLWISRRMRKYSLQVAIYTLLGVIGIVLGLAGSVVSKYIIDSVTGAQSSSLGFIAGLYLGMGFLGIANNAVVNRVSAKIQIKVQQEIRAEVFQRVMITDWESIAEYHSGDILNRMSADTDTVSAAVLGFLPELITNVIKFTGALLIILYYDQMMALIALGSAPVVVLSSQFLLRKIRTYQVESKKVSSEIMSFNEEALQNLQFIKSFGLLSFFTTKLRSLQQKSYGLNMRYNMLSIGATSLMAFLGRLVSFACYGWGVYRLWNGDITYGTMTLFLQLAGSLSGSFGSLASAVPQMLSTGTSARRVMDIVELPCELNHTNEVVKVLKENAKTKGIEIVLNDVSFTYKNGQNVLNNVNLHASSGEIIGLIGPSGQGKTTIFRLLLGLVNAKQGDMLVYPEGDPSLALPINPSTRSLFAYVPQGNVLFSGTVAENLRLGRPDATDNELAHTLRDACIDEEVLSLPDGLYSRIGERGYGFSEGQNQRLSIARSLLSDAPILLLDEATSALDIAKEQSILQNINKHYKNKVIIIATHRLSILDVCTQTYFVNDKNVSMYEGHFDLCM